MTLKKFSYSRGMQQLFSIVASDCHGIDPSFSPLGLTQGCPFRGDPKLSLLVIRYCYYWIAKTIGEKLKILPPGTKKLVYFYHVIIKPCKKLVDFNNCFLDFPTENQYSKLFFTYN